MSARDELMDDIRAIDGPALLGGDVLADGLIAAGYSKPRTITDHYAEDGTDSLRGGSVILSHGEALLVQSDGTFCDPIGSTWDFWELELPITVLYEPSGK